MKLNDIKSRALALADWAADVRHRLHRIPELGNAEHKTQTLIVDTLRALGVECELFEGSTCVVGHLRGALPGKCVALRADMDALPIDEPSDAPHASEHEGLMHACGHDAHMAVLLGAARLLSERRDELRGEVRLLFQPAEESTGGAEPMIAHGCMRGVDRVYGLHVMSYLPVGQVETRTGALNGASDDIRLAVLGVRSHAAYPEGGVDAIAIAAQVTCALHTLVSRRVSALDSAVFTIGSIHGGTASNILCDRVELKCTLRTLRDETRAELKRLIEATAVGVARALGGDCEMQVIPGYCALINPPEQADAVREIARALLGGCNEKDAPSLGVEDFSYYLRQAPGAFYHLGCRLDMPGRAEPAPLHNADFRVNDECLPYGIMMQAALAARALDILA